jgi:hypothetical protein
MDPGTLLFAIKAWLGKVDRFDPVTGVVWRWATAAHAAGAATTTAGSVGSRRTILTSGASRTAGATELVVAKLGPLVGCENGADAEQHFGVGFLKVGARLGDLVDLRHGFCGVHGISAEQRLKHDLLLFHVGLEVDELKAALLEDVIHFPALVGSESQPLDDHGVLPPHSGWADVEASTHGAVVCAAKLVDAIHLRPSRTAAHTGTHALTHSGISGRGRGVTLNRGGCRGRVVGWSRSRGLLCERERAGECDGGKGKHGSASESEKHD